LRRRRRPVIRYCLVFVWQGYRLSFSLLSFELSEKLCCYFIIFSWSSSLNKVQSSTTAMHWNFSMLVRLNNRRSKERSLWGLIRWVGTQIFLSKTRFILNRYISRLPFNFRVW
jgi:hypothetical protein